MADRRRANRTWFTIFLALCCSMPARAYVSDDDWVLSSATDREIVVYTKVVEDQPIKAVKAITTLDVSMPALLTVLSDAELVPEWIPVIGRAELLQETDTNGVSIMYMVTSFPWPIRNRDAVVETVTEYDAGTNAVSMESSGISGYVDEKRGIIRTPATYTRWEIMPLPDGRIYVELITHSDPGGWFPKWLANLLVSRTPGQMFAKLQKVLDEQQEKNRPFDENFVFGKKVGM